MASQLRRKGEVFERSAAIASSCSLDGDGLRSQGRLLREIAPAVAHVAREREALAVEFTRELDRTALGQFLLVERECCPFFSFSLRGDPPRLTVSVSDPLNAPALDALRDLLSPDEEA